MNLVRVAAPGRLANDPDLADVPTIAVLQPYPLADRQPVKVDAWTALTLLRNAAQDGKGDQGDRAQGDPRLHRRAAAPGHPDRHLERGPGRRRDRAGDHDRLPRALSAGSRPAEALALAAEAGGELPMPFVCFGSG
jgi:hypothetical protein